MIHEIYCLPVVIVVVLVVVVEIMNIILEFSLRELHQVGQRDDERANDAGEGNSGEELVSRRLPPQWHTFVSLKTVKS